MKDAGALTILLEIFTAIFAILFIPFFKLTFPDNPYIYLSSFFVVIIYAFTDRLNIEARYGLEPSTFSMLKQLSTVFLLILGFVFIKEAVVLKKIIGAVSIIFANVLLAYNKGKILNLNDDFKEIRLEDTDIYNTYKEFLNNPYGMQKILFNE